MSVKESLFLSEQLSDVTVKVRGPDGSMWRYPAHSLVLKAGSEWFHEVIVEQVALSPEDVCITFVDASPTSVLNLLRFLYTRELEILLSVEELLDLLEVSIRCKVWPLEVDCETKLLRMINVGNACRVFEKATGMLHASHGSRVVVEFCRQMILDQGQILFLTDSILELGRRNLETILQSDSLNIVEEDVVFFGLWRWGKKNCMSFSKALTDKNISDCLGGLLAHVRFSLMINPTVIPPIVAERYCQCAMKKPANCCCLAEITKEKCRQEYKFPRGSVRLSGRIALFDTLCTWHEVSPVVDRLLCLQFSVEEDIFVTAVEVAVVLGKQLDLRKGPLFLTLTAEDSSIELHREELSWDEVAAANDAKKEQLQSTIARFGRPVEVRRRTVHSLHVLFPRARSGSEWQFPAHVILSRKKAVACDGGSLLVNVHTDRVIATSSVYFLPGGRRF